MATTAVSKIASWEQFSVEIKAREEEIASQLPSTVTRERFINSAIAAVKRDPTILQASPRSLFAAIIKSASDGLLPDGREGVITVYAGEASWNPMIYGLRKRARETDGLIVDTQVVYANDFFDYALGDEPHISHKPAGLGTPRGPMLGAYAVFKDSYQTIIHREVMDATQIQQAQKQSKKPDSVMWVKFTTEAWRKVVARRGFKSVPSSAALMRVVTRDDDQFDFKSADRLEPPAPPPEEPAEPKLSVADSILAGGQEAIENFLSGLETDMSYANSRETVDEAWDTAEVDIALRAHGEALERAYVLRTRRLDQIAKTLPAQDKAPETTVSVGLAASKIIENIRTGEPIDAEPPPIPEDDDDSFPGDRPFTDDRRGGEPGD